MQLTKLMSNIRRTVVNESPRFVASLNFLLCGLAMGYTFAAFAKERNNVDVIRYGPLMLGVLCAFLCSMVFLVQKWICKDIRFWHFDILLAAGFFNIIGGCFFFVPDYDLYGAFSVFIAHGLTFVCSLSYIHITSSKGLRSIYLSGCFIWYILGIASGIALISEAFATDPSQNKDSYLYNNFAWVFLPCAITIGVLLVLVRVLELLGAVEYKIILDDELRIANLNNRIFEGRNDIINRVRDTKSFFYVTKNKQWLVSLILLFSELIYSTLFTYFIFWFSLNSAVQLFSYGAINFMLWTVLLGVIIGTIAHWFFSVKVTFVTSAIGQIVLTVIGMISYATMDDLTVFWVVAFLFGIMFSSIKISILETSLFLLTELLIFASYLVMLVPFAVINVYFVSNLKNLFFYGSDHSTLVAHGFVFLIIVSMLSIIVALQVPKTYKCTLYEIQYKVLGIIFTNHSIEQLNLGYLRTGMIPTVEVTETNHVTSES